MKNGLLTVHRSDRKLRGSEPPKGEFKRQDEQLLAMNVIQESISPFASTVAMVKKKDGSLTYCINFQKVNERIFTLCR